MSTGFRTTGLGAQLDCAQVMLVRADVPVLSRLLVEVDRRDNLRMGSKLFLTGAINDFVNEKEELVVA